MKYDVVIDSNFKTSFNEAYTYISEKLKAKKAAKSLRKKMKECIINLGTIPEAYPQLDNLKVGKYHLRFCSCKNFMISFVVVDKKVYVYNFFYSKSEKYRQNFNKD